MNPYFETVRPTYIENWPAGLMNLSVASAAVKLSLYEAQALGAAIAYHGETFQPPNPTLVDDIRGRVAAKVALFPKGCFIRLGSRSPKDSWELQRTGGRVLPGEDPLRFMLDESERISDDLHLALSEGYCPTIWVREWLEFEPWQEARCFVGDGKLAGISQYDYFHAYPEHWHAESSIEWAIRQWFTAHDLAPRLEADYPAGVIVDVVALCQQKTEADGAAATEWNVRLLELNPWFEMTDPCLFSWQRPEEFDGRCKWVNAS